MLFMLLPSLVFSCPECTPTQKGRGHGRSLTARLRKSLLVLMLVTRALPIRFNRRLMRHKICVHGGTVLLNSLSAFQLLIGEQMPKPAEFAVTNQTRESGDSSIFLLLISLMQRLCHTLICK